MATITTTGAGDWNTGGNWDAGVPGVGDDAVVAHAMTVDGTGATFATLDNNSTITLTANQTWTIAGAGSIDNAGGTITCSANNPDVTFTSSNTTKWTWQINSGTWTDGTGTHTFEYADLWYNGNVSTFNSGTYVINADCTIQGTTASDTLTISTAFVISAGVTVTLGDGVNSNFVALQGDVTMVGTSGSHIIIDGQTKVYFYITGTGNDAIDIQYVDVVNGWYGMIITSLSAAGGDTFTFSNNTFSNCSYDGIQFKGNTDGEWTISDCSFFSNGDEGIFLQDAAGCTVNINDCSFYSNTGYNIEVQPSHASTVFNINRAKAYACTTYCFYMSDVTPNGITAINSSLFYENTNYTMITYGGIAGTKIFNCTFADGGTHDNIYLNLASGIVCPITNTISANAGRYGVNSIGVDDPVVTYCDVNGSVTAEFNGMTDPTGSNGNIDADPKFTDAAGDDYDIGGGSSPCINTGTSTGAPANDILDVAWPNANPEMGCYGEEEAAVGTACIGLLVSGTTGIGVIYG